MFDGPGPRGTEPSPEHLTVIHAGHGGHDSADDRIVELVGALPDRSMALVYTSDARAGRWRTGTAEGYRGCTYLNHRLAEVNLGMARRIMKGHESLAEPGFRLIAQTHPGAVIQCPIDFLAPLAAAAHEDAERMLERLRSWGINRFSIAWRTTNRHMLFDSVERWGFEINLYDVPDIEAFLRAVSPSCCPDH